MTYSLENQVYAHGFILMGVSLVAWERSSAQFNMALTIADIFVDLDNLSMVLWKSILTIIMQLAGASAAIGLCHYMVQVEVVEENGKVT